MKKILPAISIVIAIVVFCVFIYGISIVAKNISYNYFYKDMVKETIIELVNPDSLKK